MKEFYLHDGQDQVGPFSAQELKDKQVNRDTHVWRAGMANWERAADIPELRYLFFNNTPPPFKTASGSTQRKPVDVITGSTNMKGQAGFSRNLKMLITALAVVLAAGIIFYLWESSQPSNKLQPVIDKSAITAERNPGDTAQALKADVPLTPLYNLDAQITMRGNFIGEKVFEGLITNKSTTQSFKDAVVEITFLSKTGTPLGQKQFTIYERIGPRQSVSIKKIKVFAPNNTRTSSQRIISATLTD